MSASALHTRDHAATAAATAAAATAPSSRNGTAAMLAAHPGANPFAELMQMNNETKADWLRAISPTNLRYLTAIRGHAPADQSAGYTYAMLNCGSGQILVALAAANPEGQFFGFGEDADALAAGAAEAEACGVENVKFAAAPLTDLAEALPGQFDYVVASLCGADAGQGEAALAVAAALLREGGLCYTAYDVTRSDAATVEAYLPAYQAGMSNTDRMQQAARAAGLAFTGSAKLRNNYLELTAPAETHATLTAQAGAAVYENLKDIASGAAVRHDVFAKGTLPAAASEAARFGSFVFALPTPAAMVEPQFAYHGKKFDLTTPLYARLLAALADMPHTVGDLLESADLAGTPQEDLLASLQLLVAAGIAEPARRLSALSKGNFEHLQFAGRYNSRLRNATVNEAGALLASPTLGRALLGSPPMVMTLQALDAGGLTGAEEILDGMLQNLSPAVRAQIPADLTDQDARRNTAFRLLEQAAKDWLLFCCTSGILQPS